MSATVPDDLQCREMVELVTEYLEGALSPEDLARFEHHLGTCPGCVAYLHQLRGTLAAARRLTEASLPDETRDLLLRAFQDWKRRRPRV